VTRPEAARPEVAQPEADRPTGINGGTVMHLPIKPGLSGLYLGNVLVPGRFEPHRVQGFAGRAADTAELTTARIVANYGLDKIPGWGHTDEVYFLKFYAGHTFRFRTSFGSSDRAVAAEMGVRRVLPPPFLGTGYFPGVDHPLPEYVLLLTEIPVGAELWVRRADESEQRLGQYHSRKVGWISEEKGAFGESAWFAPPVALPPTIRRGFAARYRGGDFDADLAGPGRFVLYPMPGTQAPQDFRESYGARMTVVDQAELEGLTYVRNLCTWRGANFEILDRTPYTSELHLVDEDYLVAGELGLIEVDYRVWRATAPNSELTDVRVDVVPVPIEGIMAS